MPGCCGKESKIKFPERISFKIPDYFKVIYSWMFAFKNTFIVQPGLYYTGERYDINAPLLVTCNYHMTVFILWRILKERNVRILVIDTHGINVWCSSGKGQFSAKEIIKVINMYDRQLIDASDKINLVLPKLSLSGVSIAELRENGIIPKIGPVYARDLIKYLDDTPLKNRTQDAYHFTLKDRLFTLIPSLVQTIKYSIYISVIMFIWNYFFHTGIFWQIIPIVFTVVTLYILLFKILPTKQFTVKGIALFIILAGILSVYYFISGSGYIPNINSYLFYLFFTGGCTLFFALSYTGNSGVSNYSLVKKEVIRFLPITIVMFLAAIITLIITGLTI